MLPWSASLEVICILVAASLIAGVVVIVGRRVQGNSQPEPSIVRSWIAIALVLGLLVLAAASLGIDDTTLRSTLIGGFTSSAGGAIAYYFSTKAAEQARQDLISTMGSEVMPDLTGLATDQVKTVVTGRHLRFTEVGSKSGATVAKQDPPPGAVVPRGATVTVTYSS